jgi:ACS family hexuronate transporter-like MFS transporter
MKISLIGRIISFVKRQEKPFKVNMVRASFQHLFTSLTQQYESIFIVSLGADPFQLGLVNSFGGVASSLISLPTGFFADRYGIRRMFLLGIPLVAAGSLIFFLSHDWLMIIPALFITLLSLQILNTVCPMVCGKYLKKKDRATGMQLCDTISAIPSLISPVIAAIIITELGGLTPEGIRPLYGLQVVGFLFMFLLVFWHYRDTSGKKDSTKINAKRGYKENMKEILVKNKNVKKWIVYRGLSNLSWFLSLVYLPLFVVEVKGVDQFILGGMATTSMIVPLFLSIPMGKLADTIGRKKVIYIVAPLYLMSVLLLIFAPNSTILLISSFFQGFLILGLVTQGAITQELVPPSLLGTWWGILNLLSGIMRVLGPILGGFIWTFFGPVYVFLFILFLEISKLSLLWLYIPETLKTRLKF